LEVIYSDLSFRNNFLVLNNFFFHYPGRKLSSLIKLKRIDIGSLGEMAALEWFSCEGSTSHGAPHISDSLIILLAIQVLLALSGGIQIQVYT